MKSVVLTWKEMAALLAATMKESIEAHEKEHQEWDRSASEFKPYDEKHDNELVQNARIALAAFEGMLRNETDNTVEH